MMMVEIDDKQLAILKLKARFADRLPFCPDHRDKVAGKQCRECRIERLERLLARWLKCDQREKFDAVQRDTLLALDEKG